MDAAHGRLGLSRRVRLHPTADGLWLVGPEDAAVPMRALRGHTYIGELLRRPGRAISALDLVTGGSGVVVQAGLGDVLDRQAIDAYRQRLGELEHDLAEAEDWSDLGRLDALHAERDALVDELAAATGLGGRIRSSGSSQERARVAATKAITAAIESAPSTRRSAHTCARRYAPACIAATSPPPATNETGFSTDRQPPHACSRPRPHASPPRDPHLTRPSSVDGVVGPARIAATGPKHQLVAIQLPLGSRGG